MPPVKCPFGEHNIILRFDVTTNTPYCGECGNDIQDDYLDKPKNKRKNR